MSFMYPRTLTVTRPVLSTAVGAKGYGGVTSAAETTVATGIPASIQYYKRNDSGELSLPANAGKSLWRVMVPPASAALGLFQTRDILTDDLGQRYQVAVPYWNSMGHALIAERLEA